VPRVSERTLLFLVGSVQFVNVLDFMMVMPLGPYLATGLGIPLSELGLIGGAYMASAAVASVVGSAFLDRFDRRSALAVVMLGLFVGTAAGGFASGLGTMLFARAIAGAFGGPATALSVAIVADVVPPERRGAALGKVMGSFTIASVFGVPTGLFLAQAGGWRAPFFAVAALGLILAGAAIALMPRLRGHLERPPSAGPLTSLARNPAALLSIAATAATTASGFAIVPNIASWFVFNLGFPQDWLGVIWMAGGAVTFFTLRLAGRMVDRFGAPAVATAGTALLLATLGLGFGWPPGWLQALPFAVVPIFMGFMVGNSTRNVSVTALSTRVPAPSERARFLSAQSAVQHLTAAAGASLSSRILSVEADGRLAGMRGLVILSGLLSLALPFLLAGVARRLPALRTAGASTGPGKDALLPQGGDRPHGKP
jgi:predicted MFS family arabinose efflux permease